MREGQAVAAAIGGDAVFERVDVSNEEDTKRLAKAVNDRFGRIDVLINNAAIFYGIDNFNSSYEYLRKIFDVNYFGTWLMCRAVFPYMEAQGSGSVINQSSSAAWLHMTSPMPDGLPSFHYSVTKAAINADDPLHGRYGRRLRHPRQRHRPRPDAHRRDQGERTRRHPRDDRQHDDGHQEAARSGRHHRHRGVSGVG
jgi:NAD(P)-dependent dehydrogenase (short-subunit alcohol dehydrogenase family)